MKPTRTLGETRTPDGARFSLHEHDGDYFIRYNGTQLMSSTSTVSEEMLADLACDFQVPRKAPKVLIGGLGLGFSLRRVLRICGRNAKVQVAELLPEVIEWNRQFLTHVNGKLLNDSRVKVITGDVFDSIRKAGSHSYDAILLDVDNGPKSWVRPQNARIYKRRGFEVIRNCLTPGGRVAFWAAEAEPGFTEALQNAGFYAEEFEAKAHPRAKRAAHRIYIGERPGD